MNRTRWRCPVCRQFRLGPLSHRHCREEKGRLTGPVMDAIHKRQDAGSEEFTKVVACVQHSWLATQRSVAIC